MTVDVNNRLRAEVTKQFTRVDAAEIEALNTLAWGLVEHVVPPLLEEGRLDLTPVHGVVA